MSPHRSPTIARTPDKLSSEACFGGLSTFVSPPGYVFAEVHLKFTCGYGSSLLRFFRTVVIVTSISPMNKTTSSRV